LIDELVLSAGFVITNESNGLIALDRLKDGHRIKCLDLIPHWVPALRRVLNPHTAIIVQFGFGNNASHVARMAYKNADALAQQMVQLATTHDWIDGFILDYEEDCGYHCQPGPDHGVQNLTECLRSRLSCETQEADLLATFFKTLSTAFHAKGKTLSFSVSGPRGAGYEHWPYYSQYLDAGVDRLYEMGELRVYCIAVLCHASNLTDS